MTTPPCTSEPPGLYDALDLVRVCVWWGGFTERERLWDVKDTHLLTTKFLFKVKVNLTGEFARLSLMNHNEPSRQD